MNEQIENIIQAVCGEYGVTPEEVLGRSREQVIADARMMAVYLAFRKCDLTISGISKAFTRNHSTVCYCIHRIEDLLTFDKPTKRHYESITAKL